jgi:hypothetical protein
MSQTLNSPFPSYRASIDSRFLSKVDRVFDASPRTVFNELLQNSRRAGATEVTILLEATLDDAFKKYVHVTFSDNGRGVESPEPLLRLAGRGWDDATEDIEDPAGMGFFCLSNFDKVIVHSRDWTGEFTPEVFRGERTMTTYPTAPTAGTVIRWRWYDSDLHAMSSAAEAAAEYCGGSITSVAIRHDGGRERVITPKGFLDGCQLRRELPDLGIEMAAYPSSNYLASPTVDLNFYGVRLPVTYAGAAGAAPLSQVLLRDLSIRVNVLKATALQLVLPARNALKHNAGRDALLYECERLAYEWVALKKDHTLPFSVYARARDEFGIDIGEAKDALMSATGSHSHPGDESVLVDSLVRHYEGFAYLFKDAMPGFAAYRTDPSMVGYSWYDSIPVVTDLIAFRDGNEYRLDDLREYRDDTDDNTPFAWADSLKVVFKLSDGTEFSYEPAVLMLGEGTQSDFGSVSDSWMFYVDSAAKNDKEVRVEVLDAIYDVIFEANSDSDNEMSTSDQSREFVAASTAALLEFIGDDQGAASCILRAAISAGSLNYALDKEWAWSIHKDPSRSSDLVVVGPHLKSEVGECRKLVTIDNSLGDPSPTCELVSRTPITLERATAYMVEARGFNADDGDYLIVNDYALPVDLDAWEATQKK